MTAAEKIEKTFDDAHVVIAGYRARKRQLIRIIDDRELHDAVIELLKTEGRESTLAPS
jgi:hypothetical protein